jgi:hypothetical protein
MRLACRQTSLCLPGLLTEVYEKQGRLKDIQLGLSLKQLI